jgi:DNA-binding transcriptional LysR family regulator
MAAMGSKSREVIYGGRIIGAKIRAEGAREAAQKAVREADRAAAELWSIQMEAYGGRRNRRQRSRNASTAANRNELMVDAAAEGLGIAFVPERLARPFLDDGHLCVLLEDWSPAIPGLCLYYPGHRHVPPALRVFIDDLRAADASARSV